MQYKIENVLQFSLAKCVEHFLHCLSFSTYRSLCQYFDSGTNCDSDCELADLFLVVVDSQLNAYVF